MQDSKILNKRFKFKMPLITKSADFKNADRDEFGCKHISFGLSTTVEDLQGDTMTDNAMNKMVELLKENPIAINDGHNHSLRDEIGPTTDVWIEDTDLIVDLRVRKMWEDEIEDVLNSGLPVGGSIEGVTLATKTITQKSMDDGFILKKEIIDDLQLFAGALTAIPAAWNLRGTAKSKTCTHSMCAQIQKSMDMKNLGVVKIKKSDYELNKAMEDDTISVINTDGSFESLRADIDEALSAKYADSEGSGMRGCWIRYTFPDKVVVEPWVGDDVYVIPYARDVNTDEITLGDPTAAETQIVTKMIKEFEATNDLEKAMKTFNDKGGDKLTKEKDEGFVKKIKGLFDSGHLDFMKSNEVEPIEEPPVIDEPEEQGGEPMEKTAVPREEIQKMIDEGVDAKTKDMKTTLESITSENKSLKHKALITKALDLHKKINPTKDGETDINEEDFMKSLEESMIDEEDPMFNKDAFEANPDFFVKTEVKSMERTLSKTPDGDIPNFVDKSLEKQATANAEKAKKIRKDLNEQGR
ncbi:hypothetical protein [Methanobacterium spitsbergense]|uniref:Uncharacterized protein n=1 Tax=Methanobacterium spitsbergense TaxID=2874285 RepID=A0A8T5USH5_9EURY|nr:hypothetical protein [Methanobacterium spitsbergense]MBZ2167002.1 hypothetical protein [Methanobacterium spitsbergense]